MRRSTLGAVCLAAFLGAPSAFPGEESFSLDLSFESSDFPDLDANPVIDGAEGDSVRFTANLLLASAGLDGGPSTGVQGWSLSVWHAGVVAESLSVEGTVSARETEGGFLDDPKHSFLRFEVIDPERNNGRRGFIQAVVLSFQRQTVLPPNTLQVVGKVVYGSTIIPGGRVAFVRYEDGLVGSGRPVINVLTVQGQTITPSLAHRDITIGAGASPEICGDGADNDRDGWIDCNDPDCANAADCGAEVCGDGIDNDGDLLTDCADPDCARSSLDCREICADGRDNDGDGRVDCDDADCIGRVDCPALEVCGDGVDNDEDGATDCDDADCDGHPVCRVREDCQDGVDNDGDGRVDCDDPECVGVAPCPDAEDCRDGVDNDRDGLRDCDDPDCMSLADCRDREDCQDGVDNDVDGRVDCDDSECAGIPPCPPAELCEGGEDEDGDGLVDCDDPNCRDRPPCGSGASGFDVVLTSEGAVREIAGGEGDAATVGLPGESNVVDVAYASSTTLEVITYIVPFPEPQAAGVQGWSLSISHATEFMEIDFSRGGPTIEGTDAGELISGGFEKTETVASDGGAASTGGGQDGFVSAVVLSFTQPITLDPTRAQSIARATYLLRDSLGTVKRLTNRPGAEEGLRITPGAGGRRAVGFADGLRGSGQPVRNALTIGGATVTPIHQIPLEIRRLPGVSFVRGDGNDDGRLDLADVIWILNELVRGGPPTLCRPAGDINDDGRYDVSDPIYLVQYLFLDGAVIPPPFPGCGLNPEPPDRTCPDGTVNFCP